MDITSIVLLISLLISITLACILGVWIMKTNGQLQELGSKKAWLDSELTSLREELVEARNKLEHSRGLEIEQAKLSQKLVAVEEAYERTSSEKQAIESIVGELQGKLQKLFTEKAELKTKVEGAEVRLNERNQVEKRFTDAFKVLSGEVLKSQQETIEESFKTRNEAVEKLVKPLSDKIEVLDKARSENAGEFRTQISNLMRTNKELAGETQILSNALKRPDIRGRWGETQLERVLELSGLRRDIDFTVQDTFEVESGRNRTDVIVRLPQERTIILDSKISLAALIEAFETEDETKRSEAFDRHVTQVKHHVDSLAKKEYWNVLSSTPDMVVMVLPEFAFLPAIEREPGLTERALEKNVIIVTPPALLALLKAVEMSWQQIRVAETARQISDLGKEMYERLAVFAGHYVNVGNSLRQAIERYNRSVGSWDNRVAASARRFPELNVPVSRDMPEVDPIDTVPSSIQKLVQDDSPRSDPEIRGTESKE